MQTKVQMRRRRHREVQMQTQTQMKAMGRPTTDRKQWRG